MSPIGPVQIIDAARMLLRIVPVPCVPWDAALEAAPSSARVRLVLHALAVLAACPLSVSDWGPIPLFSQRALDSIVRLGHRPTVLGPWAPPSPDRPRPCDPLFV